MLISSVDVDSHCKAGNIPMALKDKTKVGIGFKVEVWGKIAKAGFLVPQTPLWKWDLDDWLHKSWLIRNRCIDVRHLPTPLDLLKPNDPPSEDPLNVGDLPLRNRPYVDDADSDPSSKEGDSATKADGPSSGSPSSDNPTVYFPPLKKPPSNQARLSPPSNAASLNPTGES